MQNQLVKLVLRWTHHIINVAADYTIDSIEEFIKDESLGKNIKTKIITHEIN
jgi:hypothetical protein